MFTPGESDLPTVAITVAVRAADKQDVPVFVFAQ
jgi:hypothetical protein